MKEKEKELVATEGKAERAEKEQEIQIGRGEVG